MSISTIVDTVYTYRFLKLLTTPFDKMKAYKLGIIDKDGKRTDKKITTSSERNAFNLFHRLAFNLKRLLSSVPGGKTRIASYIAALALLKESFGVDTNIILENMDMDHEDKKKISDLLSQYMTKKEEIGTTTSDVAVVDKPLKPKLILKRKKKK